MIGTTYNWVRGKFLGKNIKTGDEIAMEYKDEGWVISGGHKIKGDVCDKDGNIKYKLKGKWNQGLTAENSSTGKSIDICQRLPEIKNWEHQYFFNPISINLNYLNVDMTKILCPTDARFRPDQRALEYGDVELAQSEKIRLEQKQRNKRKEREENNEVYKPRWFKEE